MHDSFPHSLPCIFFHCIPSFMYGYIYPDLWITLPYIALKISKRKVHRCNEYVWWGLWCWRVESTQEIRSLSIYQSICLRSSQGNQTHWKILFFLNMLNSGDYMLERLKIDWENHLMVNFSNFMNYHRKSMRLFSSWNIPLLVLRIYLINGTYKVTISLKD